MIRGARAGGANERGVGAPWNSSGGGTPCPAGGLLPPAAGGDAEGGRLARGAIRSGFWMACAAPVRQVLGYSSTPSPSPHLPPLALPSRTAHSMVHPMTIEEITGEGGGDKERREGG